MPDLLASVLPETDTGLRVPPGHATVHLADQSLQLERRPPPGRKAPALDGHPTVLTPHMPAFSDIHRLIERGCAVASGSPTKSACTGHALSSQLVVRSPALLYRHQCRV